jgi:hypothetical protein
LLHLFFKDHQPTVGCEFLHVASATVDLRRR